MNINAINKNTKQCYNATVIYLIKIVDSIIEKASLILTNLNHIAREEKQSLPEGK